MITIRCKIKRKVIEFWYWLTWFVKSRNGRRVVGKRILVPLFNLPDNPKIQLGRPRKSDYFYKVR